MNITPIQPGYSKTNTAYCVKQKASFGTVNYLNNADTHLCLKSLYERAEAVGMKEPLNKVLTETLKKVEEISGKVSWVLGFERKNVYVSTKSRYWHHEFDENKIKISSNDPHLSEHTKEINIPLEQSHETTTQMTERSEYYSDLIVKNKKTEEKPFDIEAIKTQLKKFTEELEKSMELRRQSLSDKERMLEENPSMEILEPYLS